MIKTIFEKENLMEVNAQIHVDEGFIVYISLKIFAMHMPCWNSCDYCLLYRAEQEHPKSLSFVR